MIRLCSCIKTVPDMDKVTDAEWASVISACRPDFSYTPKILDPYCESACELILRMMADAPAGALSADAVTIGEKLSERPLRTLAALGFDGLYRISDAGPANGAAGDPARTAGLLAAFCRQNGYDAVILGMESFDTGSRMVPYFLAEELGMPCISDVISMSLQEEDRLRLTHREGDLLVTETIETPVVLTIGDIPSCLLRVPTLRQRSAASKNPVRLIEAAGLPDGAAALSGAADLPDGAAAPADGPADAHGAVAPADGQADLNGAVKSADGPDAAAEKRTAPFGGSPELVSLSAVDQSRKGMRFDGTATEAAAMIYELCRKGGVLK